MRVCEWHYRHSYIDMFFAVLLMKAMQHPSTGQAGYIGILYKIRLGACGK
jgi:hypothetical protein